MPAKPFLHEIPDFEDLIRVLSDQLQIRAVLVEKDYWLMHCLWGLRARKMKFELKGGTSLSKGWNVIHRFSEDIDIKIEPPSNMQVLTGNGATHRKSRQAFFDFLAIEIQIPGIEGVDRDTEFDDKEKARHAGFRLRYPTNLRLGSITKGSLNLTRFWKPSGRGWGSCRELAITCNAQTRCIGRIAQCC